MTEGIRLLDEIAHAGHEASILTTYNAHLPFYERVVLPKLASAGCRHNVVLMDARECVRSLGAPESRPRRAGTDYALLPIQAEGAFHPKVMLLVGKRRGRLIAGSHNLTLSGFGHNRELTNAFEVEPGRSSDGLADVRLAWGLIKAWCAGTPRAAREAIDVFTRIAPWLVAKEEPADRANLAGTSSGGPSLWQQFKKRIEASKKNQTRGGVERALVLGAFFDQDLAFLKALRDELEPRELVVGVDPSSVRIPPKAQTSVGGARFVNACRLREGRGYLHAKALLVEMRDGRVFLATGSANPSAPAWLAAGGVGNIEAVVIREGGGTTGLGLRALFKAPALQAEDWGKIASVWNVRQEKGDRGGRPALLAFETAAGFEVEEGIGLAPRLAELVATQPANAIINGPFAKVDGFWRIDTQPEIRSSVTLLVIEDADGTRSYAVPFRASVLASLSETDAHKELRRALLTLDTNAPEIEGLLRVVGKVIFDDRTLEGVRRGRRGAPNPAVDDPGAAPESLGVEEVSARHHRRLGRYGVPRDLALVLEALIHRLGLGLDLLADGRRTVRVEEEALPARDSPAAAEPVIDGHALAALCRNKTRTLLRRLGTRLLSGVDDNPVVSAFQVAAVLGVLKQLSAQEGAAAWVPRGEHLVEARALHGFFESCAGLLCYPGEGLLDRARVGPGEGATEEVSACRGLLLWCGWLAGVGFTRPALGDDREVVREGLAPAANLAYVCAAATGDRAAREHFRAAVLRTCHPLDVEAARRWASRHGDWSRWLALRRTVAGKSTHPDPAPGDVAFVPGRPEPLLVIESQPGRVVVADPLADDGTRTFATSFIRVVGTDWNG